MKKKFDDCGEYNGLSDLGNEEEEDNTVPSFPVGGVINQQEERYEDPELPYVLFDPDEIKTHLEFFSSLAGRESDILPRACLFEINKKENKVKATMSDGIFQGSVSFSCLGTKGDFPEVFIIDCESLVRITQYATTKVFLAVEKGSFFVDFFGGRVHIPSYSIGVDLIKDRVKVEEGGDKKSIEIDINSFLLDLSIAREYLSSNRIPNLTFCFVKKDGLYLSNGYTLFKGEMSGVSQDFTIRRADIPFLITALKLSMKYKLELTLGGGKLWFKSPVVDMIVPSVMESYPDSYMKHIKSFCLDAYYTVDFSKFNILIFLLSKVHRSSGVVLLKSKNNTLFLESKSLDGKISYLVLSASFVGKVKDCYISFGVDGLEGALRSMKVFDFLNIAIGENSFCLFNEKIKMVVFGIKEEGAG